MSASEQFWKNENEKLRMTILEIQKSKDDLYSDYVDRYHQIIKAQEEKHEFKAIAELAVKALEDIQKSLDYGEYRYLTAFKTARSTLDEIKSKT